MRLHALTKHAFQTTNHILYTTIHLQSLLENEKINVDAALVGGDTVNSISSLFFLFIFTKIARRAVVMQQHSPAKNWRLWLSHRENEQ